MGQPRKDPTPSVHSMSSASDVSSASTASIHKRSTPKIAAVIIVAFLIISALAGVTVYFITSEKLLMSNRNSVVEKRIDELSNFQDKLAPPLPPASSSETSFFSDFSSSTAESTNHLGSHLGPQAEEDSHEYLSEDEYYDDDSSYEDERVQGQNDGYLVAPQSPYPIGRVAPNDKYGNYYTGRLGLPTPAFNVHTRKMNPGPRFRNEMNIPKHLRNGQDSAEGPPYLQYEEVFPTRESNALIGGVLTVDENGAEAPATLQTEQNQDETSLLNLHEMPIFGDDFSKKIHEEITEEPNGRKKTELRHQTRPNLSQVTQRFFESGMRADPNDPTFARRRRIFRHQNRMNQMMRARGQVFVSDMEQAAATTEPQKGPILATLDRRPNRPSFHHLGPPEGAIARGGPPYGNRQQINRRMGGAILENMQEMIGLAKNEVGVLRELAKNITENGKELNLWEILDAVNATVTENPTSGIARLMKRFYANYLTDESEGQLTPAPGTYEKSLSSLIFLSFGIFLLNSVNEHITQDQATQALLHQARSLDSTNPELEILRKLMSDHESLGPLFGGRSLTEAAGKSNLVNNYLRLLMNLMNIYTSADSERDVDCVWQLYCLQLNQQAKLGGMASSVAKINSVGMKLVLEEIPGSAAIPAVFRSMMHWQDLQCQDMFPKCVQ